MSKIRTCTRRLEFDAAHRVMKHESKCAMLHGHRFVVEITAAAELDTLGRVIDFSVLKSVVGGWIDEHLDHGTIAHTDDGPLVDFCLAQRFKLYRMKDNPTAENLAAELLEVSSRLLKEYGVQAVSVRVYETPNGWSDAP